MKISYQIRLILLVSIIFFAPLFSGKLMAQFERTAGKMVNDAYVGGIIEAYNLEKANTIEGSVFMYDTWQVGCIELYDGKMVDNMPMKYNLRDDFLLLQFKDDDIRILAFNKIKSFNWFNLAELKHNYFVNCLEYNFRNMNLNGFYEIVVDGPVSLICYHKLYLQKATYSEIHDAGNPNDEFLVKEELFLVIDNQLILIHGKKTLMDKFGSKWEAIDDFCKENKIKTNNKSDLSKIVEYYNSLVQK